jgi:hypothetical protein
MGHHPPCRLQAPRARPHSWTSSSSSSSSSSSPSPYHHHHHLDHHHQQHCYRTPPSHSAHLSRAAVCSRTTVRTHSAAGSDRPPPSHRLLTSGPFLRELTTETALRGGEPRQGLTRRSYLRRRTTLKHSAGRPVPQGLGPPVLLATTGYTPPSTRSRIVAGEGGS